MHRELKSHQRAIHRDLQALGNVIGGEARPEVLEQPEPELHRAILNSFRRPNSLQLSYMRLLRQTQSHSGCPAVDHHGFGEVLGTDIGVEVSHGQVVLRLTDNIPSIRGG